MPSAAGVASMRRSGVAVLALGGDRVVGQVGDLAGLELAVVRRRPPGRPSCGRRPASAHAAAAGRRRGRPGCCRPSRWPRRWRRRRPPRCPPRPPPRSPCAAPSTSTWRLGRVAAGRPTGRGSAVGWAPAGGGSSAGRPAGAAAQPRSRSVCSVLMATTIGAHLWMTCVRCGQRCCDHPAATGEYTGFTQRTTPAWATMAAMVERSELRRPDGQPVRVLVVDDEADAGRARRRWRCGWRAGRSAARRDGLAAVRTAREFRPDAVVLDVMLPDIDGLEVLRRMRADAAARCPSCSSPPRTPSRTASPG